MGLQVALSAASISGEARQVVRADSLLNDPQESATYILRSCILDQIPVEDGSVQYMSLSAVLFTTDREAQSCSRVTDVDARAAVCGWHLRGGTAGCAR